MEKEKERKQGRGRQKEDPYYLFVRFACAAASCVPCFVLGVLCAHGDFASSVLFLAFVSRAVVSFLTRKVKNVKIRNSRPYQVDWFSR